MTYTANHLVALFYWLSMNSTFCSRIEVHCKAAPTLLACLRLMLRLFQRFHISACSRGYHTALVRIGIMNLAKH